MADVISTARTALVTGGAKRVGRAIVERLSRAGFAVAFTYFSSESGALEVARACGAFPIRADLTQPLESARAVYGAFTASFNRLDVLVNNASLYEPAGLQQANVELARRMMAIHYETPLLLCKHFEGLLRSSRGHVVNMLDLLVERSVPRYMEYSASKAALANLTISLARELAPEVTVNGIAPGVVEWPANYPEAEKEKYLRRVPLGRPGKPEDVAETIHFLATGGSYITGQTIRLDGGRSVT